MKPTTRRLDDPLLLVAGFLFLLIFTARAPFSWGEASRLATVESLVERGTPVIDEGSYPGQADKLLISGDRFLSHKPPGMQLVLVPFYLLLTRLGFTLHDYPSVVYVILTLLSAGAAWLFCGYVLHRRHRHLGIAQGTSLILVASILFGTLVLPYGLALNAHLPAGALVLIGMLLLHGESERYDRLVAGLLFGLAFSFDHAAVFLVAPALIFRLLHTRTGFAAILSGLVPGIALSMAWYYTLGGSLLPLVFQQERFDYAYSPWLLMSLTGGEQSTGLLRNLWSLTFGQSGLFFNHPVLLFPLAGLAWQWRRNKDWTAGAALVGVVLTVAYYGISSRNLGGDCFGIRWFALMVPAMGLGLLAVAKWLQHKAVALAFGILLVPSIGFAGIGASQPWMKLHLENPDPLRASKSFREHMQDEFRRRASPPPGFTMLDLKRFYRSNLRRLAAVTRAQAKAGGGQAAYRKALEKTGKMLVNTTDDPVLWEVHAELLEGAGRYTDAAAARKKAAELRESARAD